MDRIGIWNVRGLNDPVRQQDVKNFILTEQMQLIALVETKVKEINAKSVLNNVGRDWNFINNYAEHPNGRIWVLWKENHFKVEILNKSSQHIHAKVTKVNNDSSFVATFVYGSNDYQERRELWNWLRAIAITHKDQPWITLGDFNAVRYHYERRGGNTEWPSYMDELNQCAFDTELEDHRYIGLFFTWTNKQPANPISTKIDRVLVNTQWDAAFPNSFTTIGPSYTSDHSTLLVHLGNEMDKVRKPFKFFDMWTKHPSFKEVVAKLWMEECEGHPLAKLFSKLKLLKPKLKELNKKQFSNIQARFLECKQQLEQCQLAIDQNPQDSRIREEEKILLHKYVHLSEAEESFARQKSREHWLNLGDKNSAFFFKSMKKKQLRNRITTITTGEGNLLTDFKEVKTEFVSYFQQLLGTKHGDIYDGSEMVRNLVCTTLNEEHKSWLCREVNVQEIEDVMLQLPTNKAPGPDGYSNGFFKATWEITKEDVSQAVSHFFRTGIMYKAFNATSIALIPKVSQPTQVADYRPISCCNTIYKCIAKILANRIQKVLPFIVSNSQSAFIKGRKISDMIT